MALFAFLMVEFVYPELRIANSLSREGGDIGTEFGAFEGIGNLTADENAGESVSGNGDKSGDKAAVPIGEFDVGEYDPNDLSGEKTSGGLLENGEENISGQSDREKIFPVSGGIGHGGEGGKTPSAADEGGVPAENEHRETPTGQSENGGRDLSSGKESKNRNLSTKQSESSAQTSTGSEVYTGDNVKSASSGKDPEQGSGGGEKGKVKSIKGSVLVVGITAAVILLWYLTKYHLIPTIRYQKALRLIRLGKYTDSMDILNVLDGYRDSEKKIGDCQIAIKDADYDAAIRLKNDGS